MKTHLAGVLITVWLVGGRAYAQDAPPDPQTWYVTMSFANLLDANVSHTIDPIRSYGTVPSLQLRHERPDRTGWTWTYEVAAHNYTGTDEWDRISQNLDASIGHRLTKRLRTETSAEANWKGSSDDREVANTFGVAQRAAYRLTGSTRLSIGGAYRYKVYGDSPGTSGASPYIGGKVDQRLHGDLRLTAGYRYQMRLSQTVRDRYRRAAYTVTLAAPLGSADRISLDLELRTQQYQRLIKVAGRQVPRIDRRTIAELAYARKLNERSEVRWICGFESRTSNDPSKRFVDPTFGMTMGYRLR
jgi:hypothetical protein